MRVLRTRGFTLLEVLIALLVFSLGLVGMAGLMVVSVRTNHSAYMRSQANFIAQGMADRMRANLPGVWANSYNSAAYPLTGAVPNCSTGCTPADLATRDQILWSNQLTTFLPNSAASIACVLGVAVPAGVVTADLRPPYSGVCTMSITWDESPLDMNAASNTRQTFAWVFQP